MQASHRLGQTYLCHRRFRPGGRVAAAERGGGGQGVWHAQSRLLADPVPGVAGADLERARGLHRGPAPRGGRAPPRHAGRPRGHTDPCPRLPRPCCTSPKGTWSTPSGCSTRVWPSAVPPATGPGCEGLSASLGYAYALQGRLAEGRTLLEEAISDTLRTGGLHDQAHRVAWLSEVWRLAGRREEAGQHARQALDLARQQKARGQRGARAAPAWRRPGPRRSPRCRAGRSPLPAGPGPGRRTRHAPARWLTATSGWADCTARPAVREQARAALSAAIDLYRAMDMTFWLPQAEAALAQVT